MDGTTVRPRNKALPTYRRRGLNASIVASSNEDVPESGKSKKRHSSILSTSIRYGYRKQIWQLVWILGITVTSRALYCLYGPQQWKDFSSNDTLPDLASSLSEPVVNQSTHGYKWDGTNDDEHGAFYVPPENERWLTPRKDVFRFLSKKEERDLERLKKDYETFQSNGMLLPCRLDDGDDCFREITPSITGYIAKLLRPASTSGKDGRRILLRNSLQEDRFWCGRRILGGGGILEVIDFPDQCGGEKGEGYYLPYMYSDHPPTIPKKGYPIDTDGITAVELFWNINDDDVDFDDFNRGDTSDLSMDSFPCTVPCKLNDNYSVLNTINVRNTNWTILLTMEGGGIYEDAQIRPSAYRENQFYATTSFKSEIPVPYFSWQEYNIQHAPIDFHKAIKGASFLANNCESMNKRERVVEALIETPLRVDSHSGCLNNADPIPGVAMENKTAIMEQYLFHLAFENQNEDDYITEKLWGALAAGTLPVYLGASNVREHVPSDSIILAEDFNSPQDLAKYLIRLTHDKNLYESYHKWRYQPIDGNFTRKYGFTKTHSNCRMCKWVFAKRHGFGWNHLKQKILEPYIRHKTCRNEMGLIGYPFKEYWLSSLSSPEDGHTTDEFESQISSMNETKSCTLNEGNRMIEVDRGAIRRKVYDRDGVTDFIIDDLRGRTHSGINFNHYILRLVTPLKISSVTLQLHVVNDFVWWLQDDDSRFYIMVSGLDGVKLSMHKPGTIEISIPRSNSETTTAVTTRVRIVTENTDHFHHETKKTPSYFGDLMTRDFFDPIASYRIRN